MYPASKAQATLEELDRFIVAVSDVDQWVLCDEETGEEVWTSTSGGCFTWMCGPYDEVGTDGGKVFFERAGRPCIETAHFTQRPFGRPGTNGDQHMTVTCLDTGAETVTRNVQFDLTTSPYLNAGTYSMKDLFQIATDPDALVDTKYSGVSGNTTLSDTYGVNGGKTVTAPTAQFTIQPFNGVSVTNSMTITKNGTPLNTPLVNNEADPANTVGVVSTSFQAEYKVSIANQTDKTASAVEAFIAVPKVGQNFGTAFSPDGAQQFDLTFVADSVPDGWTVHYLKMNAGKTYDVGAYPHPGDYTEVTDPSKADMIMVSDANGMDAGASTDVTFKVTSPQDLNDALDKQDTWGCISRYEASSSEMVPTTTFPESLKTSPNTLKAEVTKTIDHETLKIGQTGTYSITVKNTGGTVLTGYYLVDTMPSQLSYSSCSDSGTYDSTARTVTWKLDLAAGASKTVTVSAVAKEVGTADNVATLYSPDPTDSTMPDVNDPVSKDDATATIEKSDIAVTKTGDKGSAVADDEVTYTIAVTNPSDIDTTGVYVYDEVPTNTTLVSYSAGAADGVKSGAATDGTTYVSWFFKTLGAHETQTVTMTVKVNKGVADGTVIKNTAKFEVTGAPDSPGPGTEPDGKTNEVNVNVNARASANVTPATSKAGMSTVPETDDDTNFAFPAAIALLGAFGLALSARLRCVR